MADARVLPGLVLALALGCTRKGEALTPEPGPAARASLAARPAASEAARPRPITVRASIDELGDMLDLLDGVMNARTGEPPFDARGQIQADLLTSGFGPAFFQNLDLQGTFAVEIGYPVPAVGQPPTRPSDWEVAGVLPVRDARGLVAALPDTARAQPLGDGLWEVIDGEHRLRLRAAAGRLELGDDVAALDRAARLTGGRGAGRRIRAEVVDLPPEWLDPRDWLGAGAPGALDEVVRGITRLELAAEAGTRLDAIAVAAAEGPFARLGLDPLGSPVTGPSPLAALLPGEAVFALQMPWGDPRLIHEQLDRLLGAAPVPAPFDTIVHDWVAGTHGVLDAIHDEIVVAAYLDGKDRATLVFASAVRDQAGMKTAVHTLMGAAQRAFSAHSALQGDDPKQRYRVNLRSDARVGSLRGERLTVEVPVDMRADLRFAGAWLGRSQPALDAIAVVTPRIAVLAVGSGAQTVVGELARQLERPRPRSLESDDGLALARRMDGGCQVCVALDPRGLARAILVHRRDAQDGPEVRRALARVRTSKARAPIALAVRVVADRASAGIAIPRALLTEQAPAFMELWSLVDAGQPEPPAPPPGAWERLGPPEDRSG
jgi:hypothetical protein